MACFTEHTFACYYVSDFLPPMSKHFLSPLNPLYPYLWKSYFAIWEICFVTLHVFRFCFGLQIVSVSMFSRILICNLVRIHCVKFWKRFFQLPINASPIVGAYWRSKSIVKGTDLKVILVANSFLEYIRCI